MKMTLNQFLLLPVSKDHVEPTNSDSTCSARSLLFKCLFIEQIKIIFITLKIQSFPNWKCFDMNLRIDECSALLSKQ